MPRYYGLILSPNIEKTVEGYIICKNVPICRSGYQEYLGRELVGFPGYEESWGLDPNGRYKVYRPPSEVLHPDTIASFEGKSIVDEHPDGGTVHIENEQELNCGHIQNVRNGPDHDGEVTLQGDIHIKNQELVQKVLNEGVRDVSCGYTLKLRRNTSGNLEMWFIRGNHVAVVGRGRAGSRIAIRDSAPPEITQRKVRIMSLREMIFGRGIKAMNPDATPEEVELAMKELNPPVTVASTSRVATDAHPEPGKPAGDKEPHRMAAHDALDRALDAMKHEKKMGKDAHGKDAMAKDLKAEVDSFMKDGEEEMAEDEKVEELKDAATDAEHKEGCECDKCMKKAKDALDKKLADEKMEKDAAGDEGLEGEVGDKGQSVLHQLNDSIIGYIRASKPVVAAINNKPKSQRTNSEQVMLDSYNTTVRTINKNRGSAYSVLTKAKIPEGIPAVATDSAAVTAGPVDDPSRFFEGVSYKVGKKRYEEHLAQKGK
jgi:hypothetical protein